MRPVDCNLRAVSCHRDQIDHAGQRQFRGVRIAFQRRMRLEVKLISAAPNLKRLIHDLHLGSYRGQRIHLLDILRIHPQTAVRHAHTNAIGPVGAVDQVPRQPEAQRMFAKRIVVARRHHPGQRIPPLLVLLAHTLGRIPARILDLRDHLGRATVRSFPFLPTDGNREGVDLQRAVVRLVLVIEAQLRHVHHDPRPTAIELRRPDKKTWDEHFRIVPWKQHIDVGVRNLHFPIALIIGTRDIKQRIAVGRGRDRQRPEYRIASIGRGERSGLGGLT